MLEKDRAVIFEIPGNDQCIDCGDWAPEWASLSHGIVICLDCSGKHRGLGTHISRVRSILMDAWTEEQVKVMTLGGNEQCRTFLSKHGIKFGTTCIRDRYDCPPAELYRQVIQARMKNIPEPTKLPEKKIKQRETKDINRRKMEGFGSHSYPKQENEEGLSPKQKKIVFAGSAIVFAALALAKTRKGK